MKKPGHLLLVFTSLVLACVLVFAVACKGGCKSCKSCADSELESIDLTLDNVKTEYYTGDIFTSGGLKITANFTKGKPDDTITNETDGVEIDSSAFNQDKMGAYEIKVSYTLNEKTAEATYTVNVSDVSISVDPSSAQRLFVVNEDDFSSDGLKVYRTVTSPSGATTSQLNSSEYTVGKNAFNKQKVGKYTIIVTHQIELKYLNASYEVQVIEARQGLQVSFKDGKAENQTITLQGAVADVAKADLSEYKSWIEARKPDKYGVLGANAELINLDADNVTVELYEGVNPVDEADIDSLEGGAYTVQVTMHGKDNADKDFDYIGFVNVYVIDNVKSIELKENCVTTQARSLDNTMYSGWKFDIVYSSGLTAEVEYGNSKLFIPEINTNAKAEGADPNANVTGTVVATYAEKNAKREEISVSTEEIEYTLTGNVIDTSVAILNISDLTAADITSNKDMTSGAIKFTLHASSSNKFTIGSSSKTLTMPSGITVNGSNKVSVTMCAKSNGKTASDGRFITFDTDRNFTVYVYGISSSSSDSTRTMTFTANKTVTQSDVTDVKNFSNAVDTSSNPTARATKVSGVTENTTFTLSFNVGAVNVYYILIVFD